MESLLHADDVCLGMPTTRLEYRLKRSITCDPTHHPLIFRVVSIGCFSWSCVESLLVRVVPPTRPKYWLKWPITFDLIVGLCLNVQRSFRRVFSFE
jgi:hypothetical protein